MYLSVSKALTIHEAYNKYVVAKNNFLSLDINDLYYMQSYKIVIDLKNNYEKIKQL